MEKKRLKLEWYTIGAGLTGSETFNIEGNGFYLGIVLGNLATVFIDGAQITGAFGKSEITVQPRPDQYIKKQIRVKWSGSSESSIICCLFKYE
jgi:hypothetical protein